MAKDEEKNVPQDEVESVTKEPAKKTTKKVEETDKPKAKKTTKKAEETDKPKTKKTTKKAEETDKPETKKTTKKAAETDKPEAKKTTKKAEETDKPETKKTTKKAAETDKPKAKKTTKKAAETDKPKAKKTTKKVEETDKPKAEAIQSADASLVAANTDSIAIKDNSNDDKIVINDTTQEQASVEQKKKSKKTLVIFIIIFILLVASLVVGIIFVKGLPGSEKSATDSLITATEVTQEIQKTKSQEITFSINGMGINVDGDLQYDLSEQLIAANMNMSAFGSDATFEMYMTEVDINSGTFGTFLYRDSISNTFTFDDSLSSESPLALTQKANNSLTTDVLKQNKKAIDKLFDFSKDDNNYIYTMKESIDLNLNDLKALAKNLGVTNELDSIPQIYQNMKVKMDFTIDKKEKYLSSVTTTVEIQNVKVTVNMKIKYSNDIKVVLPEDVQKALDNYLITKGE